MEPITMPTIPARTAGVNQAVRPSRMPKIPPSTKPSTILLLMVVHSLRDDVSLLLYYPLSPGPLTKNKQQSNDEISQDQYHGHSVAIDKPGRTFKDVFAVGNDRHAVKILSDI